MLDGVDRGRVVVEARAGRRGDVHVADRDTGGVTHPQQVDLRDLALQLERDPRVRVGCAWRQRLLREHVPGRGRLSAVHDFFVEFEIEVIAGSGLLHCRMWDGHDQLVAACPVGTSTSEAFLRHDGSGIVRTSPRKALQEKKKYHIEMAFVDRRVSFAIDGRELFAAYDLDPLKARTDVLSPVAIGVQGIHVIVRNMKIYRDIYYRSSGRNAVDEPLQLGKDEYFMLGDNMREFRRFPFLANTRRSGARLPGEAVSSPSAEPTDADNNWRTGTGIPVD